MIEKDTETCRCEECREKHIKELRSAQNKRYYESKNKIQYVANLIYNSTKLLVIY